MPIALEEAPVSGRISSIIDILSRSYKVNLYKSSYGFFSLFRILKKISASSQDICIILTMPPFRGWWLCLLPKVKLILDWRDGWSIAIRSGYGGLRKKRYLKAFFAEIIEFLSLMMSEKVITCTPGLYTYHTKGIKKIFKHKVFLLLNGHMVNVIDSNFKKGEFISSKKLIKVVCAGKFSEYGRDKARFIIEKLRSRYNQNHIQLDLIGSEVIGNKWIVDSYSQCNNFSVDIFPAMIKSEIFSSLPSYDLGVALIRDPDYDLGTKVFEYVAFGLPIFDYFETQNSFKLFFKGCFDTDYNEKTALKKAHCLQRIKQGELFFESIECCFPPTPK